MKNDILTWIGVIFGETGSIYEDGIFKLTLRFDSSYPYNAPDVRFETRIFHPNVSQDGKIHTEILSHWRPLYNITNIIESIREMLSNVSLDSQIIYNPNARHLFSNNRREYSKYAYKCVEDSKLEIDKGKIHFS